MAQFSIFVPAYEQTLHTTAPGGVPGPSTQIAKGLPPRSTREEARADLDALAARLGSEAPAKRWIIEHIFRGEGREFEAQKATAEDCIRQGVSLVVFGKTTQQETRRHSL